MPRDRRIVSHKYNPLLSSPASSAICTPFKPPPSVFSAISLSSPILFIPPYARWSIKLGRCGQPQIVSVRACRRCIPSSLPRSLGFFLPFRKSGITPQKHFQVLCHRGGCRIGSLIWTLGKWPCGPLWLNLFHCFGSGLKKEDWVGWTLYGIWICWKGFTFHGETLWIRWCPCRKG